MDKIDLRKFSDDIVKKYCLMNPQYIHKKLYNDAYYKLEDIIEFLVNNNWSSSDEKGNMKYEYSNLAYEYTYIVYGMTKNKLIETFDDNVRNLEADLRIEIDKLIDKIIKNNLRIN